MNKYRSFPYTLNKLSMVIAVGGLSLLIFLGACSPQSTNFEPSASPLELSAPSEATSVPDAPSGSEELDVVMPEPTQTQESAEVPLTVPELIQPNQEQGQEVEEIPQSVLDAIMEDIQARTGNEPEDVTVQQIESMNWSDTSLGCPSLDRDYRQITIPGYSVELQAKGTSYTYHTNSEKTVVLCLQDGVPLVPINPKEKIQDGEPWVPVAP